MVGVNIDRPRMPEGYGVPTDLGGFRPWSEVEYRLNTTLHVWLATTRPDGRPHVVPRWGVWLDDRFWYDGSPDTIHARNLRTNPACVLHLESGADVVIVEGTAAPSAPVDYDRGVRLSDVFRSKYAAKGYEPAADAWSGPGAGGLCVLTPIKAMAWRDFPTDVTRYRFQSAD
ncbi:MAG: pyridoxamine 5'-phosphate oxidase family protein [Acidimicrobiia bacterium]|nr:pyridoxamine 5'-phosphate oxidase family protein [Acidimicrobiia bacterium]